MGVRKVRDSAYWGMPVGTPIVKGMKPVKARQRMTSAVKAAGSPGGGGKVPGLLARNAAANPPKPSSRGTAAQRMAAGRPGGAWAAMAAARGGGEKRTQVLASDGKGGFKPGGTVSRSDAAKIMHGPSGKPAPRKASAKPKAPKPSAPTASKTSPKVETAKADIRAEVARLAPKERDFVGLADVRDALGSKYSRADVDAALMDMLGDPGVRIIPVANRKALSARDREAAINIGGDDHEAISIGQGNIMRTSTSDPQARFREQANADARAQVAEINARRAKNGQPPMDREDLRGFFPGASDAELDALAGGAPSAPAKSRGQQVEDGIRSAVASLAAQPGDYVSLEDVRARLGSQYTRAEVDQALDDMFLKPGVALTPESNQKTLTPGRRSAAVNIGAQDQHLISIEGVGGAKPAPAKAAKKTTARAKMRSTSAPQSLASPSATASFAPGASSRMPNVLTPKDAIGRLRGMSDRASGEKLLAKASRADLAAILDAGKIVYPKGGNKALLREHIIESLIGRRVDHDAIMRSTGSERYTR